jgi:SAM-dependent methyltransferase/acyl carrier protein
VQAAYPEFGGELTFLQRCGTNLASALQGRVDPLNLLFPEGSFVTAEELYEKSPGAQVFQRLVAQSVARAIERYPADRTIRILEIGAGTGGTASYVARVLPADRTEYVFTDVSPLFAARAAEKFSKFPFFRYEVLDIERDPEAQGFSSHGFDIVIASNSLHATTDLRRSVSHALQLLAPDGMSVLLEGTCSERWVDVSFGLTEGWWKFVDLDLRSNYPLLSRAGWIKLLSEAGCDDIAVLPPDPGSQQVLLLARGPESNREAQGWAVVAKPGRIGPLVSAHLAEQGQRAIVIDPGAPLPFGENSFRGIVDLSALNVPSPDLLADSDWANVHRYGCESVVALSQKLRGRGARLWVVTHGAQRVIEKDINDPVAAPVWGQGRSIALEQPEIWGGLVDLDPLATEEEQAELLVRDLLANDGEDQVAYRHGTRYVARLKRCARPAPRAAGFHADGSYLITGGLGGLGLVVARWLVKQGVRRLILVGRNGVTRECQTEALREIERFGASIRIVQADISDPTQMERLFSTLASEPPLKGVIHAAAVLSRDRVLEMSAEQLRGVLLPKVAGTWLLHRHTRHLPLDFFCMFSSTASLLGSGGLAHYAAANQFLDGFAHYRQRLGLPGIAIQWGTWDEMRTVSEANRKQYRSVGLLPMASSDALAVLNDLLGSSEPVVMVAAVDWRILKAVFEARRKRPLLEELEAESPHRLKEAAGSTDAMKWERLSPTDRENRIRALVWEETSRVLQMPAGTPMELDRGFFEMGMDSLVSVELKSRLEAQLGRQLPSMMTFNFPSVRSLSTRLASEFTTPRAVQTENLTPLPPSSDEVLAEDEVVRLLAEKLQHIQNQGAVIEQ